MLGIGSLAVVVVLAQTLAANININSGPVEFGQGVAQTTACDSAITVTPHSAFDNTYGENGDFLFSAIDISDLDSTAGHCDGKGFTIKAYGETSSTILATYTFMDNGSSFSSSYGSIDSSGESTDSSSLTLTLTSPSLLASAIYKITIESSDTISVNSTSSMRLATGYGHTCFTMLDTTVRCWGAGGDGELGNGDTVTSSVPVIVSGLSGVSQLSSGREFTCALLDNGSVNCWGNGEYGELGNGDTLNSSIPVAVSGISDATSIITGGHHACALLADRTVKCWGNGGNGELGNDQNSDSSTPVLVSGITTATAIAASNSSSCALLASTQVQCWGAGGDGTLGDGTTDDSWTPVDVEFSIDGSTLTGAVQLSGDKTYGHFCVRFASGIADCWGSNFAGELGVGDSGYGQSGAVQVSEISDFAFIAAGWANTCGQRVNGSVYCWGNNAYGQIGDGTDTYRSAPGAALDLSGITQIDPGDLHICALITGDTVYCWGGNWYGQLGDGTTDDKWLPTLVNWS